MKDQFLYEDLERIVNSELPIDALSNSTVLVTGATGLVGVMLVRAMIALNEKKDTNIRIVGLIRNKEKAESIYEDLMEQIEFVIGDICNPLDYKEDVDYIIHCASVTTSKTMVDMPVETLMTSIEGTKNMLDFAKEKKVKSFVYVSSMEMYGSFDHLDHDVKENDLGYIDPLKVRSNYPESKRLCENMCIAYMTEYDVPVKIARLAQTFGAGVLKGENRVFAQFARSAIRGENIVLHTKGLSEGNYCYTADVVRALFILLEKGKNGEAYNISNPNAHTTIADMAKMVCEQIADNKISVVFDIPESNVFGYASDTKMKLNSDKMQALGWKPEIDLLEAYHRLIGSLIERNDI